MKGRRGLHILGNSCSLSGQSASPYHPLWRQLLLMPCSPSKAINARILVSGNNNIPSNICRAITQCKIVPILMCNFDCIQIATGRRIDLPHLQEAEAKVDSGNQDQSLIPGKGESLCLLFLATVVVVLHQG